MVGPSAREPETVSLTPPDALTVTAWAQDSERADAARNRQLLLDAATQLIEEHGAAAVTMDAVAKAAGVGKGTVFRRFGSRTGLMHALLDRSETELQRSYLYGPPPLGPGAPPDERLLAFGRARLQTAYAHLDVLAEAEGAGIERLMHPAATASRLHIRILLQSLGFGDGLETLTLTLLAPMDASALRFLLDQHLTLEQIIAQWERTARMLIAGRSHQP
ncbi:TetR/AcrR family transcriptional regulator [Gordonia jinhuaensis]|nr:TetR/AcrR family transcriptional regulator [Gordonia jinhuaensis]